MSRGFGGYARIAVEDDETVIYEYGAYNSNYPDYRPKDYVYDGLITISKSSLVEPELHEKIKRMPSGRKKPVIKRIPVAVSFSDMIQNGMIEVRNCGNCWKTESETGMDSMAVRILNSVFDLYQVSGELPKQVSFDV